LIDCGCISLDQGGYHGLRSSWWFCFAEVYLSAWVSAEKLSLIAGFWVFGMTICLLSLRIIHFLLETRGVVMVMPRV